MALFLATAPGRHISGQALSVCGGARYLVIRVRGNSLRT